MSRLVARLLISLIAAAFCFTAVAARWAKEACRRALASTRLRVILGGV